MLKDAVAGYDTISIIGLCKNAGKTTVLNALVSTLTGHPLALTSVGRDGEDTDLVTGTPKPAIWAPAGTLFATARGMLPLCTAAVEVLAVTDVMTPLGVVAVFRALTEGRVQLAGPSAAGQLEPLCRTFRAFGAERVLIDGAAGRRSPAVAGGCAVLCVGASLSPSLDAVVAETAHVCRLFSSPVGRDPAARRVEGGVTSALLRQLTQRGEAGPVSVPNATHILAGRAETEGFFRAGGSFCVDVGLPIAAVAANPFSAYGPPFDPEVFVGRLREALPLPVVDVVNEREVPVWN